MSTEEIGNAIHTIRHLSKEYAIPGDACNTFVVTYQKLKEFEDDLHKHVHLENNILFLKAAQLSRMGKNNHEDSTLHKDSCGHHADALQRSGCTGSG